MTTKAKVGVTVLNNDLQLDNKVICKDYIENRNRLHEIENIIRERVNDKSNYYDLEYIKYSKRDILEGLGKNVIKIVHTFKNRRGRKINYYVFNAEAFTPDYKCIYIENNGNRIKTINLLLIELDGKFFIYNILDIEGNSFFDKIKNKNIAYRNGRLQLDVPINNILGLTNLLFMDNRRGRNIHCHHMCGLRFLNTLKNTIIIEQGVHREIENLYECWCNMTKYSNPLYSNVIEIREIPILFKNFM